MLKAKRGRPRAKGSPYKIIDTTAKVEETTLVRPSDARESLVSAPVYAWRGSRNKGARREQLGARSRANLLPGIGNISASDFRIQPRPRALIRALAPVSAAKFEAANSSEAPVENYASF